MANTYGESAHNDDGIITGILREMEATAQDSTLKLFTTSPPIKDALTTESTAAQSQVIEDCLPYLSGFQTDTSCLNSQNIPKLERGKHIRFLENSIKKGRSVGEDAYRPWILYWSLTGLNLLGKDVKVYRESVAKTLAPMQNAGGGFGGGPGQRSHLAPSYAAVLSLATVGGDVSLDLIDRRSLLVYISATKMSKAHKQSIQDGNGSVNLSKMMAASGCALTERKMSGTEI
ncbi:CAAX farnesyltransferase (FTase) subunit beta [Lecanora helva]